MDNQTPTPNPTPPTENVPVQNPAVAETLSSQVYTAPQPVSPPPSPKSFLTSRIVLLLVILLILLGASGIYLALNSKPKSQACTQEAKICSDGTSVGRTGPNCTFALCPTKPTPTSDEIANWKTYKSEKLGWQISYPASWRLVNGGTDCAVPGGGPGDENTFCFFSPGFNPDKQFTDLGFQVRTENNDEPVKSQGTLADCTFLKAADCKQVIVGNNIKTKKFLYTNVDQGITYKEERIFLLSPSKEHIITIAFNYRPCEKELISNCLKQEDYNSKSNQILSTFRFDSP